MAKVLRGKKGPLLTLTEEDLKALGLQEGKEYEITKAKQGIWVVTEKGSENLEYKLLERIKKSKLKDRVEEKFEKSLNEKELKVFEKLLKEGKVKKFKLSDQYTKSVYKLPEEIQDSYSLEKHGFTVLKNEQEAQEYSRTLEREIRAGNVIGIKDFDGSYYILYRPLYEEESTKILKTLEKGKKTIEQICTELELEKELVKGICAFLKEKGEVIEKKPEVYEVV